MNVAVATTNRAITSFGGAELLLEAARAVGLPQALSGCVSTKRRARGLSDAQFVLAMAESVALGATCLDDLAVSRADGVQAELRGFEVPAPQTAGAWLRRFSLGHVYQLDKALALAQRNAYLAARVTTVTLDFDSTYVFSRSRRRQGVDRTWKKAMPCTRCCALTPPLGQQCTPGCDGAVPQPPKACPLLWHRPCEQCRPEFACALASTRVSFLGRCSPS